MAPYHLGDFFLRGFYQWLEFSLLLVRTGCWPHSLVASDLKHDGSAYMNELESYLRGTDKIKQTKIQR